ncbi:hypothetical protein A3762_13960 [Oleiphilus sp. HI0125]|uniref:MATE family efflux transporter n=1 Tax=Oleiphilus sp. HI0125 TaxID=1822266 RepID=UPI0007C206D5|nr:MATE family efflux transporter [Oleiphilus sp. HI0125]KZZ61763.1 hypothetical protein A3762_13960 [Oleiphilus sp. HI0125]
MTSAPEQTISNKKEQFIELAKMTWPMLIGIVSLMSFQLVDSVFIARLGVEPLAVVGFTIPIYQLFIGIQVGIGIATTALISQLIGAREDCKARDLAGLIVIIGSACFAFLAVLTWLFRYPIIRVLGATKELMPFIDAFWAVWLVGAFAGGFLYFGYSIARANGNTLIPGLGMAGTSLLNIALDPIFIFTFDLGLAGAAWATLCSFSIGCLFVYPFILKKNWLHFSDAFENAIEKIKQILAVALPAMTSQLLPALSSMLATMLVAQHGTESVAAWGLGIRVEFFSIILVLAMTMSLPPMIGKSYGAKNFDDIQILLKLAVKTIIAWQLLLALILVLFDSSISHALAGNEDIASLLALYIVIIPFSYAFLGICMVLVSAANAISRAMDGLKISFARLFICYLPCLFIGSVFGDLMGLMIGAAVGNVLAGIISIWMFKSSFRKAKTRRLLPP